MTQFIKDQDKFLASQKELENALKKVPQDDCGQNSMQLAGELQTRSNSLVGSDKLKAVVDAIDGLLATEYAKIQSLKKKYRAAKNEADVFAARIESKSGDTQKMHLEMGKATEVYMTCKSDIMALSKAIQKKQESRLSPVLLAAINQVPGKPESQESFESPQGVGPN